MKSAKHLERILYETKNENLLLYPVRKLIHYYIPLVSHLTLCPPKDKALDLWKVWQAKVCYLGKLASSC